nr:50S ribosomal protein L11 methyltransferase [Cytophagales bacterium]
MLIFVTGVVAHCVSCVFAKQTPFALDFIELKITVSPDWADVFVAELQKAQFSEDLWLEIVEKYRDAADVKYETAVMPRRNWNEEWEKNYQPIVIGGQCVVRASFHQIAERYPYEIVVNPQMSFGTGHHETTTLMLENQLRLDHQGKRVLDAGCGTGILAIMACKRGGSRLDAYDTDEWAVTNATENCRLNGCEQVQVQQGTIATVGLADEYDIVLANINRNVLLDEIPAYAAKLPPGGTLLLSGFYEQDVPELTQKAATCGLNVKQTANRNRWASLWL